MDRSGRHWPMAPTPPRHVPRDENGHDPEDQPEQQGLIERETVEIGLQIRDSSGSRGSCRRRLSIVHTLIEPARPAMLRPTTTDRMKTRTRRLPRFGAAKPTEASRQERHVRATTAFNKMLAIPGAHVAAVDVHPDGIVVDLAPPRQRLPCPCGWSTRAVYDRSTAAGGIWISAPPGCS